MNIFSKSNYKTVKKSSYLEDFIFGKDESLKPKFTKIFGKNYSINIYYLKIKSPELNLEKDTIKIYIPMQYRKNNNQALLNIILHKMYVKIAENELENIMEKARHTFGFAPEDYKIAKMDKCMAFCNKDTSFICINPKIVMFDKQIIEYIIFHEFCHLKYKTHSKKFYDLLKTYLPNYESLCNKIKGINY